MQQPGSCVVGIADGEHGGAVWSSTWGSSAQITATMQPPAFPITDTHWAATWLLHPDAPKTEMPKMVSERIRKMKARVGGEANA